MDLLIQEAISGANLLYTCLLGLILIYWGIVIIGALDLDFLDFDLDTDLDVESDVDIDTEVEVDGNVSGLTLSNILAFFNIGKVPFMIFLSILILSMWTISMLVHYGFGQEVNAFFIIWLVPNVFLGLFLTKLLTLPFKGSYVSMNKGGTSKKDLVGLTGELIMQIQSGKMGRMEVERDGEHFTLDVFTHTGQSIARGKQVIIVEYNSSADKYTVEPFDI